MSDDKARVPPMRGRMVAASFPDDTVTLEMAGDYYTSAGDFALIPWQEYERLAALDQEG